MSSSSSSSTSSSAAAAAATSSSVSFSPRLHFSSHFPDSCIQIEATRSMKWESILDAVKRAIVKCGVTGDLNMIDNVIIYTMDLGDGSKVNIGSAKILYQQFILCASEDFKDEMRMVVSFDDHLPDRLDYPLEPQEVLRLYTGKEIDVLESVPCCMQMLHESITATFVIASNSSLTDGVYIDKVRGNLYGVPKLVSSPHTITIVGTFRSRRLHNCEISLQASISVEVVCMPDHVEELTVVRKPKLANLHDRLGSSFDNIKGYLELEIERISLANMGITTRPFHKLVRIDTADINGWHLKIELKDVLNYGRSINPDKAISPSSYDILDDDDNCMSIFDDDDNAGVMTEGAAEAVQDHRNSSDTSAPSVATDEVLAGNGRRLFDMTRFVSDCLGSIGVIDSIDVSSDNLYVPLRLRLDDVEWELYQHQQLHVASDKEGAKEVIDNIRDSLYKYIRPLLAGIVTSMMIEFYDAIPFDRKPPHASLDLQTNKYLHRYLTNRCVPSLKSNKRQLKNNMQCSKEVSCSTGRKCRFHLLDEWIQVASCYSMYSLNDAPKDSDETALCHIIMNCDVYNSQQKTIARDVLHMRNPLGHFELNMDFNDAYDKMKQIAERLCTSDEERDRIISSIDENRTRCLRFIPAKDRLEQISQDRRYMKLLTQEQCQECKYIMQCRNRGQHLLLEAVAGSGKTMLIAYLTAQYVNEGLYDNILLVTHGKYALQFALMKELDEQLDLVHRGSRRMNRAEKVLNTEEHVVYRMDHGNDRLNYIVCCTIDHLIMSRLRKVNLTETWSGAETVVLSRLNSADGRAAVDNAKRAMLLLDQTRFDHIFVDEGHHVFNYERELHLQGQHILEDSSQVRELVEDLLSQTDSSSLSSLPSLLSSPTSSSRSLSSSYLSSSSSTSGQCHSMLTVFHDDSCQSNMSAIPYPFEGVMIRGRAMESSIRMPKSVTDQSVPFARSLQGSRVGVTEFFPLNKHAVPGVSVSYEEVGVRGNVDAAIGRVLVNLREDGLLGDFSPANENNNLRLAVIFPRETTNQRRDMIKVWSESLIEETGRRAVELSGLQPVEDIFPGVDVRGRNVVWTWAANMAGLEADIVIMVGDRIGWGHATEKSRISPDMFVAASRCMYKLIIVAEGAAKLAGHYKIGLTKEGTVEYSVSSSLPPTMVKDNGSKIILELVVDKHFSNEDSHRLMEASTMILRHYDAQRVNLSESPFQWQLCKKEMFKLVVRLTGTEINREAQCLHILASIRDECIHLKVLDLSSNEISTIPEGMCVGIIGLEMLDLTDNKLTSLPLDISCLVYLKKLWLYDNSISSIPEDMCIGMTRLESLLLYKNKLTSLPLCISCLVSLKLLRLDGNSISNIPEGICVGMTRLEKLLLNNNNLTSLPLDISCLVSLKDLCLNDNSISRIPEGMCAGLTWLETLELAKNNLTCLPLGISCLVSLKELNLDGNPISNIPEGMFVDMTRLEKLVLNSNNLTSLPVGISCLISLKELRLNDNSISSISEGICVGMTNLETLWLNNNKLTSLPLGISCLVSLKKLYLEGNSISSIPEGICVGMTGLDTLWLNNNTLTSLPLGISCLVSLKELYLEGNSISSIPEGMCVGMTRLESLWLDYNKLTCLPLDISCLVSLKELLLVGNPISCIPDGLPSICMVSS